MTSRQRSRDRPIESVKLKITFRADKTTAKSMKDMFPGAKYRGGACEFVVEGESPEDVSVKAQQLLKGLNETIATGKDFKEPKAARLST